MKNPVKVQNMNYLRKKVAAYEKALQMIISEAEYITADRYSDPNGEALKKCYKIAITVASSFAPLVEKDVLYLVKRYDGADPPYLIAYPVIDKKGDLEGWQLPNKTTYPLYPDDEVFIFHTKDLTQVVTWKGGPGE